MACHTARGGAPYAGGRGIATPFGTVYASNLTPDAATGLGALERRRTSGARCTTAARATAACSTRPSPTPTTPTSRARTATRCTPTCAACRRWRRRTAARAALPLRHAGGAGGLARAVSSGPARFEPDAGAVAPSGTAAPTWCAAWATARPATARATRWAPRRRRPGAGRRADPDAELVRALADRARPRPAWPTGRWTTSCALLRDRRRAARLGARARWPRWCCSSTQHLSDADLRAMALYLQGAAAARAAPAPAPRKPPDRGAARARRQALRAALRRTATASRAKACAPAPYPPLAGNRAVTMDPPANLVQRDRCTAASRRPPPATRAPSACRPSGWRSTTTEIAAVASFLRSSWGAAAGAVSPQDVARFRGGAGD